MRAGEQGFSYVVVMFLVAFLSIASVRALENARTVERREKEASLLWVGTAYRNAIAVYHAGTPGEQKSYPKKLEDLLYDERQANPGRPLRKLYRDPITGSEDWGLVKNADGYIMGVYSLSRDVPIKRAGFPPELSNLSGAKYYSDWKFVYQPVN